MLEEIERRVLWLSTAIIDYANRVIVWIVDLNRQDRQRAWPISLL